MKGETVAAKTVETAPKPNREPMAFHAVVLVWEPNGATQTWRAEWRGSRVYVRQLRYGWNWTWGNRCGHVPMGTADEAKAAAQLVLCGGPA